LLPASLSTGAGLRHGFALVLGIAGGLTWLWCLEAFSRHGGTPLAVDAPRDLVTVGPFAHVRNPIMTGELAVIWAETIAFASLGLVLYAAAISALAHWLVVHVEEPELRARFGERYPSYADAVPRWLPRLRGRRASQ
ncbi:MAG: methyltransferase family protein, partial [Myxococcota bacterium]